MIDSILAGLGLAVCAALLLRYALPPGQRRRLDARARHLWDVARSLPQALGRDRKVQRQVKRQADEVINRARKKAREAPPASRDGNVIRPDAFKSRPPKDKLH
jgi:hypothetical protein